MRRGGVSVEHDEPTEPLPRLRAARRGRPDRGERQRGAAASAGRSRKPAGTTPDQQDGGEHGQGHAHGHGAAAGPGASRAVRRVLLWLLVPLAVAAVGGVLWLYPWGEGSVAGQFEEGSPVHGTVVTSATGACSPGDSPGGGQESSQCQRLRVRLTDGPDRGSVLRQRMPLGVDTPRFAVDDDVVLSHDEQAAGDACRCTTWRVGLRTT